MAYRRRTGRAAPGAGGQDGKPCLLGAAGPSAFDCSGLAQFAWRAAGVSLPRATTAQFAATADVAAADLKPGDLVFFYSGLSHVGIYLGNAMMVDAPHAGSGVRVESIAYLGPVMGASRPSA